MSLLQHILGTFSLDIRSLNKFSLVSICFLTRINILRFVAGTLLSGDPWVHVDCLFLVRGTLSPGIADHFEINEVPPAGKR